MTKGRDFAPSCVLFDGWYASLDGPKQFRHHGWRWIARLEANRVVTPEDRISRPLDEVALGPAGRVVHLRGRGPICMFRADDPDGVAGCGAGSDLGPKAGITTTSGPTP